VKEAQGTELQEKARQIEGLTRELQVSDHTHRGGRIHYIWCMTNAEEWETESGTAGRCAD